ncbi:MAG: type I 3-dehydroquinate dehydratase [bacterium]
MSYSIRSPICLPLISKDFKELINDYKILLKYNPDLIEWRVDKFKNVSLEYILDSLKGINKINNYIPLLFTLRDYDEGGYNKIDDKLKNKILINVIETGLIDIVDYEINNIRKEVYDIKKHCSVNDIKLLLSYHDYQKTPNAEIIYNKLLEGEEKGANIVKVVTMANEYNDVNTLFKVTDKIRMNKFNTPYILIAMGEKGIPSRVLSGLLGSSFIFAEGHSSSAPGQLFIDDLRLIWDKMMF